MKHNDYLGLIPSQYTGMEIEADATVELGDQEEGKAYYNDTKGRLLNVNSWHRIAGGLSAEFQLVDNNGKEIRRFAKKGDYLKIDIPGPGSKAGNGYDWVIIEELVELNNGNTQSIGFRARPCKNPVGDKRDIAHFYSKEGTSNFIVMREGKKVSAWIVDRNIKPNDETSSMVDSIRDSVISMGAIGMFSKTQWQGLAKGLLKA